MKKLALSFLILAGAGSLSAQSKYGILTYQLPGNWEQTNLGNNLALVNPMIPNCKIGIFTVSPSEIDTDLKFSNLRSQKMNEMGFNQAFPPNPIYKEMMEEWRVWTIYTEINSSLGQLNNLSTISNDVEGIGIIYESTSSSCFSEMQNVFALMGVEPTPGIDPAPTTNTQTTKNPKGKGKPMKDLRTATTSQKGKGKN